MSIFTDPETWLGGFYELELQYPTGNPDVIGAAIRSLWSHPDLRGCYVRNDLEPGDQERTAPTTDLITAHGHVFGLATIDRVTFPCGTIIIWDCDEYDWVSLYIPMGALSNLIPEVGSFPFAGSAAQPASDSRWRNWLDEWLVSAARHVYKSASFSLATVGLEAGGEITRRELKETGVPAERWNGILLPTANGLDWFQPTNTGPPFTFA